MPSSGHLFLASVLLSALAAGALRVVISWIALQGYGSSGLAIAMVVVSVGQFVGAFSSGTVTDRLGAKSAALLTCTLAALCVAALASVDAGLVAIAACTFVGYASFAVHDVAMRTLIPSLVVGRDIKRLTSSFISILQVGYVIAPAAIGLVLEWAGIGISAAAVAVSALIAGALIWCQPGQTPGERSASETEPLAGGLEYLRSNKWLWIGFGAAGIINFAIVPLNLVTAPAFVTEQDYGPVGLGYLYSALAVGFVGGSFLARYLDSESHAWDLIFASVAAPCLLYALFYLYPRYPTLLLIALAAGFCLSLFEVLWTSSVQSRAPREVMGRLLGFGSWTAFAARSCGTFLAGVLAAMYTPASTSLLLAAVASVLLIALFIYQRHAVSN